VLIEKPLAPSVAEGEKLVAAAEDRDLVLMCDHTYCYTPAVIKIRELIACGSLGRLQYYDSVRINLGLVQSDVDVFWDLGPHDLSILDFVLPAGCGPIAIGAQGSDPIGAERACIGYLTLQLGCDAIAHLHLNWLSPTKIRTSVIGGTDRVVVWDDLSPAQRISVYDRGVEVNGRADMQTRRDRFISYRIGDMVAPVLRETEPLQGVVNELAAAIREHRAPLTDGHAGLRVLRTLEAVPRSIAAGGAMVPIDDPITRTYV
jgi:predicted dehydrogenase